MDVYGEQSWWNFSWDLYKYLFDGRPKRHRSYLQMCLWMEILSREKLHLLIYFVLFLTTLWMCYRTIKGILGSCESLCLLFSMLFNFWWSLWVVVGRCGSLWVVVGHCGSFWVLVTTRWLPCLPHKGDRWPAAEWKQYASGWCGWRTYRDKIFEYTLKKL